MIKKFIILLLFILLLAGCDMAMDTLYVKNGNKYVVTSKKKDVNDYHYKYHLIKVDGNKKYDYHYTDTSNFNVGDTLVLTIKKVNK